MEGANLMPSNLTPQGHSRTLLESRFRSMTHDFTFWRMDDFIRRLEATKSKGRILPFIRGLRLSAHLIYAIRELLEGTDLTANWGHLLDERGILCSPECDIIIHRKDGQVSRWNGNEKPVMDFRFISMEGSLAVVSCKSRLIKIDKSYAKLMKKFVKRVWLFAECCGPRSSKSLEESAKKAGYQKFWYLYTWSPKSMPKFNTDGWFNFVSEVKKLKNLRSS